MTPTFFQTPAYAELMHTHLKDMISYLFTQDQEFAIACTIDDVLFSPELPSHIQESFQDIVLFVISNYSFESAGVDDEYFSFEAGFGEESFGAKVSMPLLAIKQLMLGEHPLIVNPAHWEQRKSKEEAKPKEKNMQEAENSMKALLNNPQNQKFRRKLKK